MMVNGNLPDGWEWNTLEDVLDSDGVFIDGDWVESKDQDPEGEVRLIQLADVGDGYYRNRSNRFLTHEKALELGCTFLEKGDLLIARMPDPLGRACIFPGDRKQSVTVVDVCIVRTKDANHRWLMHAINSPQFRADVESLQSGSTRKRISRKNLAKLRLPIPPPPEQERIVSRIEELFSDLEAGVRALERVRAGLKRYKASVLKAAFEGKLLGGEKVNDNRGIPRNWRWVTINDLASPEKGSIQSGPFGSHLLHSEFQETGILAIGIDNVQDEKFSLGRQHRISPEKFQQLKKFAARPLDVLITVMATVGRCCVVPENIETSIITKHVYRISVDKTLVDPYYLMYGLSGGETVRKQLFGEVRGQTRPGINGAILKGILIPLPPLDEQRRIVAEVERRLSVVGEVESAVDAGLARSARLRQAVLRSAFEGRLA